MKTKPCRSEDDCPTPTQCRGKDVCTLRESTRLSLQACLEGKHDEELRIACAEVCGWHDRVVQGDTYRMGGDLGVPPHKPMDGLFEALPNYLSDLNACAGFRKSLTFSQRLDYDRLLLIIVSLDAELSHDVLLAPRECYDATALQRSVAFLLTLKPEMFE